MMRDENPMVHVACNKTLPLSHTFAAVAMKFIILLLAIYLFYRYFLREPKPLKPPQEPDVFIDHEEVKRENEKNK